MQLNNMGRFRSVLYFNRIFDSSANNIVLGQFSAWPGSIPAFDPAVTILTSQTPAGALCSRIRTRRYLISTTVPSGYNLVALPDITSPAIGVGNYAELSYGGATYYVMDVTYINAATNNCYNLYVEINLQVDGTSKQPFSFRQIGLRDLNAVAPATSTLMCYENISPQTVTTAEEGLTVRMTVAF